MQTVAEMPFVAGHAALDFVNTAEERGHPDAGDALRTPADLRLWGYRYGLISESLPRAEDEQTELNQALEARELLYGLFLVRIEGQSPPEAQVHRLAQLAATAYDAASLRPADDGRLEWYWKRSELTTVRHVAVTSAVDLLETVPTARLKQCPGAHCGWFFLDATKRGNRRWCLMSECGQDAKDERRRARRHAGDRAHDGPPNQ